MGKKRFSEEQIINILKEAESGVKIVDLCRKHGMSDAAYYNWKTKYSGLTVSELRRLKGLEEENRRLKNIVAEQAYHESGGFEKIIGANNYWGIKTPIKNSWPGLVKTVTTHEHESILNNEDIEKAKNRLVNKYRKPITSIEKSSQYPNSWYIGLPQSFRDWETTDEAIKWYVEFIKNNYPRAFSARVDYQNYFKRLVDGNIKYATDPDYVGKCEKLYVLLKSKKI